MFQIKSDRDYRIGWEILHILRECTLGADGDAKRHQERIASMKRNLRQYANRGTAVDVGMGFLCERRIVKDESMDGYVELVSIPTVFDTAEDDAEGNPGAETFFKTFLEIQNRPSMFDCTGQAFTRWYKLFRRNGQFWAYHGVGFDV